MKNCYCFGYSYNLAGLCWWDWETKTGFRTVTAELLVNIMHTHRAREHISKNASRSAFFEAKNRNFRFLANHNLVISLKEQCQFMKNSIVSGFGQL